LRVRPYRPPKSLQRLDAYITENSQKQSVFATTHAVASGVSLTREKPEVAYKRLDDDGDAGARFGACIGPEGRPQPTNQNGRLMNIDVGCRGNGAAAAAADADSDRRRATRGVACQASVSIIGATARCHVLMSRAYGQISVSVDAVADHRARVVSALTSAAAAEAGDCNYTAKCPIIVYC